jgi:hypothetical protein
MATKNLARTVIEGGRITYYKMDVHRESRTERVKTRASLRAAMKDVESHDEKPTPKRRPVRPEFGDKVRPLYRYLDSRVGKNWDKTYAEIRRRFDTRTTPGRHVVENHLLSGILLPGQEPKAKYDYHHYFVDKVGILRKFEDKRRVKRTPPMPAHKLTKLLPKLLAFVGGKRISKVGGRYEWRTPVSGHSVLVHAPFGFRYVEADNKGTPILEDHVTDRFGRKTPCQLYSPGATYPSRAIGLMTKDEEKFFLSFPAHIQEAVMNAVKPWP